MCLFYTQGGLIWILIHAQFFLFEAHVVAFNWETLQYEILKGNVFN